MVPDAKPMMRICAPQLIVFSASINATPPTGSYTTSMPCGAAACARALAQSHDRPGLYHYASKTKSRARKKSRHANSG